MSEISKQETFNLIATHLMNQEIKSISETGSCKYYGPDELKCAIGCLIPEELYSKELEGQSVRSLIQSSELLHNELAIILKKHDIRLLVALQDIHDGVAPRLWREALIAKAKSQNLTLPECLQ